jgi:Transposase, Mutator family
MSAAPRVNRMRCTIRRVRWSQTAAACPQCDEPARRVWDVNRAAIDVNLDHPVVLLVVVSVHRCPRCGRHFRAQPPFLRPDATYTNRVVETAVASVVEAGMPMTRVARRLARDFWVRPSEAMLRRWGRSQAEGIDCEQDYQAGVGEEFSGVRCVDEVYQDRLALLVAVDPRASDGDRLIGYQLVHGAVDQGDMERFLEPLRAVGVQPEQVITDGSALYPSVIAAVWPTAAHQLCLVHETRPVTKAVLQVASDVRATLPEPPRIRRRRGRPARRRPAGPDTAGCHTDAGRAGGLRAVHALKRAGGPIRGIVRQTGPSRTTIRPWLREPVEPVDEASPIDPLAACGVPPVPEDDAPPPPWESWQQVREFADALAEHRFLLTRRPDHLTEEDRVLLTGLLGAPAAGPLGTARDFLEEWYAIWRDEQGGRRALDDAWDRYRAWRANPDYITAPALKRATERVDQQRFAKLSRFLETPTGEATNNGAERIGRLFRHQQAPHVRLRSADSIDDSLRSWAVSRRREATGLDVNVAARSPRGRTPRSWPAMVA